MSSKRTRKNSKAQAKAQARAGAAARKNSRRKLLNRIGLAAVLAFVTFALYVMFTTPPDPRNERRLPDRVGEPWEYDGRFDAYWDPRAGHEHWHEGKPPAPEDRP